jgi:hypothetical protein
MEAGVASNIERYKKDIERLAGKGSLLLVAIQIEVAPQRAKKLPKEVIAKLPKVRDEYEAWYSESLAVLKQLLPERIDDFSSYSKPKTARKEILASNYTMSDYLRGITITVGYDKRVVVDPSSALPAMHQQSNIIEGLQQRFESTLFDIRTLVQADLFDNEIDAARELNAKGFTRAAGAVAGVVLEGHLGAVCERHALSVKKKAASISDYNDLLKTGGVIEVATWRFIQHLGDIRNKCDHKKSSEPKSTEVSELIDGVAKITKTVF